MRTEKSFLSVVCSLAIPVALQSMLQSSFSIIDQIMIGQLGSVSIAGVGLAGKFASIFSVVVAAIGAVAGIMIAQYLGQRNRGEIRRSFYINLLSAVGIAGLFTVLCGGFPQQVMSLYTKDVVTERAAAEYLMIIAGTFLPMAGATLLSTLFRCVEKPKLPLYASIVSAILNTILNYILIFGKCGFSPMGAKGAAIATVISQLANFLIMFVMFLKDRSLLSMPAGHEKGSEQLEKSHFNWKQYLTILLPILICEAMWSIGENVYAAIYGHMGTDASAAMTLTNPVQGLVIGALCGLSQAASVIIGKRLGNEEYEKAYEESKKLSIYGAVGAVCLSVIVVFSSYLYVEIYQVEESVKILTRQILFAYALIAPFKVLNMIMGGGIIRSGGKTKYVMFIDMIGTWVFGVPLGLLSAFVLRLSIPQVYFILSLEECIRFGMSVLVFRKKRWMNSLEATVQ